MPIQQFPLQLPQEQLEIDPEAANKALEEWEKKAASREATLKLVTQQLTGLQVWAGKLKEDPLWMRAMWLGGSVPSFMSGKGEIEKVSTLIAQVSSQIEQHDFYHRLYRQVPGVARFGALSEEEILQALKPPADLTVQELEEAKSVISEMYSVLSPMEGAEEAVEGLELPELVTPKPVGLPTSIHTATVDAIVRLATTPRAPESIMTQEEWADFLVESGQISDKADLESYEYYQQQAQGIVAEWQERNNILEAFRAETARLPEPSTWDKLKGAILQPGLFALEMAQGYFEYVSMPLAGLVYGTFFPDIRAQWDKYRQTENTWKAVGHAWETWDPELPVLDDTAAEWILKYMIMEGAVDPLMYIGFGVYSRAARPFGRVGRAVGAMERGMAETMEIPFNMLKAPIYYKWSPEALAKLHLPEKWAGQYAIPRTTAQLATNALYKTGQFTDKYLTGRFGKALWQMNMKEWRTGVDDAIKWVFRHPGDVDTDIARAGRQLLKHAPVSEKEAKDWAVRLHSTLQPEDITIRTVDSVDQLFETYFTKIGVPNKIAPDMEASDELCRILHAGSDADRVVASKLLQDRARRTINSAYSFDTSKSPLKAIRGLMRRNYKSEVDTVNSVVAKARLEQGRISNLLNNASDRVQRVWVNSVDKWVVRPFAESYLTFALYGPMNVVEDIIRISLGGISPAPLTRDIALVAAGRDVVSERFMKFSQKWHGTVYDYRFSEVRAISETYGALRGRRPGELNNWILQMGGLAKGFGDKTFEVFVGRPGQIGQMVRMHFVDAYATQQLKRNGGELVERLARCVPDLAGIADKRLARGIQQHASELAIQGNPDILRAGKSEWTRARIQHKEVGNILSEHPDLPRGVRDHILIQSHDGELFREGAASINREMVVAYDMMIDDFIHSAEYAHRGFEQLTEMLTQMEVRNPQEMAQLIQSLNLMGSMYGATPKQIMGRAVERTRGLPFGQRRASLDKAMDDITVFREKAGVAMDRLVDKIKLTMHEPETMVNWDRVIFRDVPATEINSIKGMVDNLPIEMRLGINEIVISRELGPKGAKAWYNPDTGTIGFRSMSEVTDVNLYHELAHMHWETSLTKRPEVVDEFAEGMHRSGLFPEFVRGESYISNRRLMELFAEHFQAWTRKPELRPGWEQRFFEEYFPKVQRKLPFNPEYISRADRLFELQTAKRMRMSELGEQINGFRHEWFATGRPQQVEVSQWWDEYAHEISSRWGAANVEMAEYDGLIKNAIDSLDEAGGIPRRQRPPIKVVDKELANNDVAMLIGARGDDISRAMLDSMCAQNDRAMFVAYVMAHVREGDVGFTKEAVGRVYDQIATSLHVPKERMDWMAARELELGAVNQDLHHLWNSKLLPDDQVEAIGRFFDRSADNVEKEIYTVAPRKLSLSPITPGEENIQLVRLRGEVVASVEIGTPYTKDALLISALHSEVPGTINRGFLEELGRSLEDLARARGLKAIELSLEPRLRKLFELVGFTPRDDLGLNVMRRTIGKAPPKVPAKALKPDYANYQQLRQDAMDEAHKWYYKEFTDYTHGNMFDAILKSIYPFWTYESQRWYWLPRSFVRHPGTFTSFERWQDNTDYGYIHIPNTSVDINPFRGTIYGTMTTRLTRRDFPEYYDSLGIAGNLIEFNDFLSRYGFYPGVHVGLPIAMMFGHEMQMGEIVPPLPKTALDMLIAAFPGNESVKWISDHVFGDRFRNYLIILTVNRLGGDGTLIFSKMQEGQPLTPEEEQIWNTARREATLYSACFEQFGLFRMRTDEQRKMYEEAGKVIEEMTGFTPEQQDWLRRHGYRLWDMVGGMSPSEQAILEEMDYYRWVGNVRPLLPGRQQDILNKIELGWDAVGRFTEDIQRRKQQLQTDFLRGTIGADSYNEQLLSLYTEQRNFIDARIAEYPLMDLDNRAEYYKEFNVPQPVLHPMRELLNLYFSIELKETTTPEGEKVMDWDNFWAQRQAIEEAIPDEYKKEWEDFLSKNTTWLEDLRREIYSTYFRTYNKVWEKIHSSYTEAEQSLIDEYLYLERTGQNLDRQSHIMSLVSSKGTSLISGFRSAVSEAKRALRYANPHLDAWLFFWNRTTSFQTTQAETIYRQLEATYKRVT